MINWFLSAVYRRLNERHRRIYRYWDGRRFRRADPLQIERSLQTNDDFDWSSDLKAALQSGDSDAVDSVIAAARRAFSFPPFDRGGPTGAEAIQEVIRFTTYLSTLKKNINGSQITSEPTESPRSDSTTNSTSDSGKTDTEQAPDAQMPS